MDRHSEWESTSNPPRLKALLICLRAASLKRCPDTNLTLPAVMQCWLNFLDVMKAEAMP
jgi:hypothetical protein